MPQEIEFLIFVRADSSGKERGSSVPPMPIFTIADSGGVSKFDKRTAFCGSFFFRFRLVGARKSHDHDPRPASDNDR